MRAGADGGDPELTGRRSDASPDAAAASPAWGSVVAIVLAGVAVYANSLGGAFLFDDHGSILTNPSIRSLAPWRAMSWSHESSVSGRPVVAYSLAINWALSADRPASYHVVNIAIHLAAALTLFGLLRRTLRMTSVAARARGAPDGLALAVTLLWSMHPLLSECVTYINVRTESLMGLFYLLTLYCLLRGATGTRPRAWYTAAVACCALGMGCKEAMATAPLAALLYDRTFLAGRFSAALRQRWGLYAGLAATWAIVGALILFGPRAGSVGFHHEEFTALEYFFTQLSVITHYLRLAFWPHPLVLYYDQWPKAESLGDVVPQALLVLGLLAISTLALWRAPRLGFLGARFFLILAPSSSFVPIVTEVVAERRMYLPLAALICVVVLAVWRGLVWASDRGRLPARRAVAVGLVAVASVAGAAGTINRNRDYASEVTMWQRDIERRPESQWARRSLAVALYESSPQGLDAAIAAMEDVLRRNPQDGKAHHNLALWYAEKRQPQLALEHAAAAARYDPSAADSRANYGVMLAQANRLDEAVQELLASLEIDPKQPLVLENLARCYALQGRANQAAASVLRAFALYRDAGDSQAARALEARWARVFTAGPAPPPSTEPAAGDLPPAAP